MRASHLEFRDSENLKTPERISIIRVMLPNVAQARPPKKGGAVVPQGHQTGDRPLNLTALGRSGFAWRGPIWAGTARHHRGMVTPANVKTRPCVHTTLARAHQDRLDLSFPAVQGVSNR